MGRPLSTVTSGKIIFGNHVRDKIQVLWVRCCLNPCDLLSRPWLGRPYICVDSEIPSERISLHLSPSRLMVWFVNLLNEESASSRIGYVHTLRSQSRLRRSYQRAPKATPAATRLDAGSNAVEQDIKCVASRTCVISGFHSGCSM